MNRLDEFFAYLSAHVLSDLTYDNIYKYEIHDHDPTSVIELHKHKCWIYDQNKNDTIHLGTETIYVRNTISLFINISIANKIALELSSQNLFVGMLNQTTESADVYHNESVYSWDNTIDFVTRYTVKNDKHGNPQHINDKHVYNYGSRLHSIREQMDDKELADYFYQNYVELIIIERDFITNRCLPLLLLDIINSKI